MTDITSLDLEAAILDQKAAGEFRGKDYCFIAVIGEGGWNSWELGVAVANETGYNPISGKTFTSEKNARDYAHEMNAHIGVSDIEAIRIVGSTMGGRRYVKTRA